MKKKIIAAVAGVVAIAIIITIIIMNHSKKSDSGQTTITLAETTAIKETTTQAPTTTEKETTTQPETTTIEATTTIQETTTQEIAAPPMEITEAPVTEYVAETAPVEAYTEPPEPFEVYTEPPTQAPTNPPTQAPVDIPIEPQTQPQTQPEQSFFKENKYVFNDDGTINFQKSTIYGYNTDEEFLNYLYSSHEVQDLLKNYSYSTLNFHTHGVPGFEEDITMITFEIILDNNKKIIFKFDKNWNIILT